MGFQGAKPLGRPRYQLFHINLQRCRGIPVLGRIAKAVRRLLLIGYPCATVLGLIYAYRYYAVFDIQFLNFATPMDLLLIALANADKVALILVLAIVASLLLLIVRFIIVRVFQALAVATTVALSVREALQILLKMIAFALCLVLVVLAAMLAPLAFGLLLVPIVFVFVLMVALGRVRWVVSALGSGERLKQGSFGKAYAEAKVAHPTVAFDRYRTFLDYPFGLLPFALLKTKEIASDLGKALPNFQKNIKNYIKKARSGVKNLSTWLLQIWKASSLIILGVFSMYIALGSGATDAELIIDNKPSCELLDAGCYQAMLTWPFRKGDDSEGQPKAFIVPTLNVASLEFSPDCGSAQADGGGPMATPWARKYVRATIRQDAEGSGPTKLPSCLVHVGATDSAQFLLDFGDGEPPPPDEENGCEPVAGPEVTGRLPGALAPIEGNKCELVARVGPFASGLDSVPGGLWLDDACGDESAEPRRCGRTKFANIDGLLDKIRARRERCLVPTRMFLIGRADSEPINDRCFRSNDGLAQARANWVWEQLQGEEWAERVHSVRLSAGPHAAGDPPDAFDRSVEVHICWGPLGSPATSQLSGRLQEKLGAKLLSLVESYEAGRGEGGRCAGSSKLNAVSKPLSVRILAASEEDVKWLEQRIRDAGGSIEANFESSIFAVLPVSALPTLTANEAVWRVDLQQRLFASPTPTEPIAKNSQNPKENEE